MKALRIIGAEDDPVSRMLLETLLRPLGDAVTVAKDGEEAWELLERETGPLLVVLDWMMPGLDGEELCRRIRASETLRGSHVIMLTARASREDIVSGLDAGADDYLAKPPDRAELAARVRAGARILALREELSERVRELELAMSRVRSLEGLLPICAYCKRIRNPENSWTAVEEYVAERSHAEFTHGICPGCLDKHF